jgi:hypothetical protein
MQKAYDGRAYLNQPICSVVASKTPPRLHMLARAPTVDDSARVPNASISLPSTIVRDPTAIARFDVGQQRTEMIRRRASCESGKAAGESKPERATP